MNFSCSIKLFTFFLILLGSFGYAQDYPDIKKGKIETLDGTNYLLVTHKKKTGIYDKSKEKFLIPPQKIILLF